ncbi:MAG: DNA-binding protein [Bacteroidaceae bacterium]|nr:DNA-binding protein [Bacteroidaceae bacterium]
MLRYQKYQSKSTLEGANGKWFIRVVNDEMMDLNDLAKHMAKHNSGFSKGQIKGILTDMVDCIKELLIDGKTVKIEDLAIFSLGVSCKPSDTANEATPDKIRSYTFNARGTGELSAAERKAAIRMKEDNKYSID